jgi:transposase InsO family protein
MSNRGTQFTSQKWSEHCRQAQVKIRKTAVYHPECDGLSVRKIQAIKKTQRLSNSIKRIANFEEATDKTLNISSQTFSRTIQTTLKKSKTCQIQNHDVRN